MIQRTREQRRKLDRDNRKAPRDLVEIPRATWPPFEPPGLQQVFRSRDFLVQVFDAPTPATARLSVCRTELVSDRWRDGITWDELQKCKDQCGFRANWAVEIYPSARAVVNVANMRHLWVLPMDLVRFAWNATG